MPDSVESKVLSHPDMPPHPDEMPPPEVQVKLEAPETPPPPAPKKRLKPCPVEWLPPHVDLTQECLEPPPISETMVRDLSYAILGSFLLGAFAAGSIAFFSRRASTDA